MSPHLADRIHSQLAAARSDAALARHELEIAQDAAHFARVALEGIADELSALGLDRLADRIHDAHRRLLEVDPFAIPAPELADAVMAWG